MPSPTETLRRRALAFYRAGVAAADPYRAVQQALAFDGEQLNIGLDLKDRNRQRIGNWPQIHPIAFGKAACAMAAAARDLIPPHKRAREGIAVTTYDNVARLDQIEVIGAGHPVPDAAGIDAARRVVERIQSARPGDLILVLISGGGSALLPAPVEGISLDEKIATTRLLLACGAEINEINCVRKHLSRLKGGGLAKLASGIELHALILSDVLGDDLGAIASGPTVADNTTFDDAIAALQAHGILDRIPANVRHCLEQGAQGLRPETPKPGSPIFKQTGQTLVGSNAISVDAVLKTAERDYRVDVYSRHLRGEARIAAEKLAAHAGNLIETGFKQATAIIAGGETTVSLSGNGKGGRNQEMALAFALAAESRNLGGDWTFLSGGTDGIDGPTDAAGGIVDSGTLQRIRQSGLDPLAMLHDNDAYHALDAANDLLITGATGTNVADLQILLLHPANEQKT